jgi:hypothetical protein
MWNSGTTDDTDFTDFGGEKNQCNPWFPLIAMPTREPTDLRRHRAVTDRNLLVGFFVLLFVVGGALIYAFYGGAALASGLACVLAAAVLAGLVALVMAGLERLSRWMDRQE